MADHGEKPTLGPAWDSRREWADSELAVCVTFRASLYILGEQVYYL